MRRMLYRPEIALRNHAAGGNTNLRYLEGIANFNAGLDFLLQLAKHTNTSCVNLFDCLVDDAIRSNLNAYALCSKPSLCIWTDTKLMMTCVGSVGENNVDAR